MFGISVLLHHLEIFLLSSNRSRKAAPNYVAFSIAYSSLLGWWFPLHTLKRHVLPKLNILPWSALKTLNRCGSWGHWGVSTLHAHCIMIISLAVIVVSVGMVLWCKYPVCLCLTGDQRPKTSSQRIRTSADKGHLQCCRSQTTLI